MRNEIVKADSCILLSNELFFLCAEILAHYEEDKLFYSFSSVQSIHGTDINKVAAVAFS